jgi:hypothetical protein
MTTTIKERSGTRVSLPEGNGGLIDIRIMGWEPGSDTSEGSSGDYPVAAIVRDFGEAFPVGTRMRANHDGLCEAGGDIRRIMAKTIEAPRREKDGMYAKARVKEGEPTDFVRQFADVIGTSVSVAVELEQVAATDDDGDPILDMNDQPVMVTKKSERGVPIVKRFLSMEEAPYNSIDFVEAPGADGRIVSFALESAKAIVEHTQLREAATFALDLAGTREKDSEATPPRSDKEEEMTDEERDALLAEAAQRGAAAALEAIRPAAPDPEQPTLGSTVEAVITAGLTEAGRAEVYARIERGESLADAVAAETAREASIEAEVQRRLAEQSVSHSTLDFGFTTDEGKKELVGDHVPASLEAEFAEFEKAEEAR